MARELRIAANGRICLPADVRARLGVTDGDLLDLEETEYGLVLRTPGQRVKHVQGMFQEMMEGKPSFTVDDFLRERRATWGEDRELGKDAA